MKTMHRLLFALLSSAAALSAGMGPALAQTQAATAAAPSAQPSRAAPDALIRTLSNEVLDSVKKDKALATDLNKLNALIDEKILPYVSFEKMTQLAVGRNWRQATPEQRQALTREFRQLLVRTYSGAVAEVSDHQIRLRPFRAGAGETDVVVRTEVVPSRGDTIQLDYRLEKTDAGWKIYDVNVLGVWLVENYRNSFASEVSQKGIDGLIRSLVERNRGNADPKKS